MGVTSDSRSFMEKNLYLITYHLIIGTTFDIDQKRCVGQRYRLVDLPSVHALMVGGKQDLNMGSSCCEGTRGFDRLSYFSNSRVKK